MVDFQKKDWQFRDIISENELNRMEDGIEEGITKAEQAQQIANEAKNTADAAQSDLAEHVSATTGVHGATSAATPNTIVQRDAQGRIKAAAPAASDDVARKAEVDGKVSKSGDTMTGLLTALGGIDLEVPSSPTGKVGRMHANGITKQIYYHDGTDWREVWNHGNNPISASFNGYLKLANGLIIQWGFLTDVPSYTPINVVFPITFPNVCFNAVATLDSTSDNVAPFIMNSVSPSGFIATHTASTGIIRWIAIGG
jgi:hypothetical protein